MFTSARSHECSHSFAPQLMRQVRSLSQTLAATEEKHKQRCTDKVAVVEAELQQASTQPYPNQTNGVPAATHACNRCWCCSICRHVCNHLRWHALLDRSNRPDCTPLTTQDAQWAHYYEAASLFEPKLHISNTAVVRLQDLLCHCAEPVRHSYPIEAWYRAAPCHMIACVDWQLV